VERITPEEGVDEDEDQEVRDMAEIKVKEKAKDAGMVEATIKAKEAGMVEATIKAKEEDQIAGKTIPKRSANSSISNAITALKPVTLNAIVR